MIEYAEEKVVIVVLVVVLLKNIQGKKWYEYLPLTGVYVILVLSITLFGRETGAISKVYEGVLHKYSIMFTTGWWGSGQYIAREIIGNIILFIPLGQLLSVILRGKYLSLIAVFGFLASLAIETTQHRYGLGTFEVADLIHNTIGAVCGYFIYKTEIYLKGIELWNHIRSHFLWH